MSRSRWSNKWKVDRYNSAGEVFYNSTIATTGFTKTGAVCNSFDVDSSDSLCPVRFDVYWEPVCPPTGDCLRPRIKVIGKSVANKSPLFEESKISQLKDFEVTPLEESIQPPVAVSDIYYTMRNSHLNDLDLVENDQFPVGQEVTVQLVRTNTDSGASLSLSGKKVNVNYTTVPNFHGLDKFDYKIIREDGKYAVGSVWVKVMNPYTWTGDKSIQWNDPENWCGSIAPDNSRCMGNSTLPSLTSVLYFDNTCSSSFTCVPTSSGAVDVNGIIITDNGFTQGSGSTITIGVAIPHGGNLPSPMYVGWRMSGGVFNGGNSKITINAGAPFYIGRGIFNSTSDTLELGLRKGNAHGDDTITKLLQIENGASFIHRNGSVRVFGFADGSCSHKHWAIETGMSLEFYNFSIDALDTCWTSTGGAQLISMSKPATSGRIRVLNQFNHVRGTIKGDWYVSGNLNVEPDAIGLLRGYYNYDDPANIYLDGTADQTYQYTNAGDTGYIIVNKPSGRVLPATGTTDFKAVGLDIRSGEFIAPSQTLTLGTRADTKTWETFKQNVDGTFTHNNGTVDFRGVASGSCNHKVFKIISPSKALNLNNVTVNVMDTCWDSTGQAEVVVASGTTVNVAKDFVFERGVLKGVWNLF